MPPNDHIIPSASIHRLIHIKAATLVGMQVNWYDAEPRHFSPQRIASLFARQGRGALCAPGQWTASG
jgi:hypothetical protein